MTLKNALPVFAIVGRPNVGKSTLFNYLTKSRAALVADLPGVTRDRQYGEGVINDRQFIAVDTGGLLDIDHPEMAALTEKQVNQAITEADVILFVVEANVGVTTQDQIIAKRLRKLHDKVQVVVNKADHLDLEIVKADFFQLGFGLPHAISAKRGRGIVPMITALLAALPPSKNLLPKIPGVKIAIVGRPNVGKSTLINNMLGEERVVVSNQPGTTRDSIYIPFKRRDQDYVLIDTAGIRKRAKIHHVIEKFSVIKTLQAMEQAHVVLMVMNAKEGITEQDLRLLGLVLDSGKGVIMLINQWDGLEEETKQRIKESIDRRLSFMDFARRYFISALHGTGVGELYRAIHEVYQATIRQLTTHELTAALEKAQATHQPPLVKGRRIRLRYAHLGGHDPMIIVIHGKQVSELPLAYQRFLTNFFRETFNLLGVPIHLHFKNDKNPYVS